MKVVVVEDDADVRELVRIALEAEGDFAVAECAVARDAVLAVERARPDIVLLDVMMPEVDGVSVARALRAQPSTTDVGIVFMTACLRPHDIDGYVDLGALDVIAKPFDPSKLAPRLRTALAAVPREAAGDPLRAASREGLERGYRLELGDRVRDIQEALAELSSLTAAVAQRTALLAHRMAGSAAIFGMQDVSEAARALEDALGRYFIEDAGAFCTTVEGLVEDLRRRAAAQAQPS